MKLAQQFVLCLAVITLAACGGGYEGTPPPIDSSSQALKIVGATNLTLVPSEMGRVEITGGTRPYTVESSNRLVALASISDNILSVAAVRGDLTPVTVTVTDARNAKANVQVLVTNSPQQGNFSLSERVFSISPGSQKSITIIGGTGPFTAASLSPLTAGVSVNGNVVSVSGLSEGANAEIKIFDTKGVTQSVFVTVAAPMPSPSGLALFSNMPDNLSLRPLNSVTFTLGGGTPPYTLSSSNPAVLSGEVRGAALILKPGAAGNAMLTVSDSGNGRISQRVFVQTTAAPLALSATSVSAQVASTASVGISGGMPPYTALSNATNLAGSGVVVSGDQLLLTGQFAGGPGLVTVKDSEGATARLDFFATSISSPTLVASPSALTISELLTSSPSGVPQPTVIPIRLLGGKPPYRVFTSFPRLLRGTVDDATNTLTISTLSDSGGVYAPCVAEDTVVAITVIDSNSGSAEVAVTIRDNGPVCPR